MFATNNKGNTNLKLTLSPVKLTIGKVLNNVKQILYCIVSEKVKNALFNLLQRNSYSIRPEQKSNIVGTA